MTLEVDEANADGEIVATTKALGMWVIVRVGWEELGREGGGATTLRVAGAERKQRDAIFGQVVADAIARNLARPRSTGSPARPPVVAAGAYSLTGAKSRT
jgi:hypothetical protein